MGFTKGTLKYPQKESLIENKPTNAETTYGRIMSQVKYTNLRTISMVYRIIGYTVLIFGIIALIFLLSSPLIAFGTLLVCIIISVSLFALSESIMVLIDIEENTRASAAIALQKSEQEN